MLTPAVITGLVVGAVLGTGLLCLGTYFVHRYMDLQCRKINKWFDRNALKIRKDDVESGNWDKKMKHNQDDGLCSAMKKQTPNGRVLQTAVERTRNDATMRRGDGFDNWHNGTQWADERQMQAYVPQPAPAHMQPTAHPQALGWEQYGTVYDQMWYPPAVFRQAVPGTYYAYVPPRPDMTMQYQQPSFGHPGLYDEWFGLLDERRRSGGGTQQAEGRSESSSGAASKTRLPAEPASVKCDCLQVVGEYPAFIEEAREAKDRQDRKKEKKRRKERNPRSSSTDLGTCSSSRSSASTEDIPRDSIPAGAPRKTRVSWNDSSLYPAYTQRTARAQGDGNPYTRHSPRSERGQGRYDTEDLRWELTRQDNGHAGQAGSKPRRRGGRTRSETLPEGRGNGGGSVQSRNIAVDPSWMKTAAGKSGSAGKEGAKKREKVSDRQGRSTEPASPTTSELHNKRVKNAADGGVPQVVVKEPTPSTVTARPIDYTMTPARWDMSAGAGGGRDSRESMSTEVSFHYDQRQ
ncbi:hypothetical protein BU25DRAFT_460942 [Macroventuria anomochaeta]|uniref:Uncharacterized protein n=1 Tax=Macroventuria anomochaeta TaxID=301207 RepID=A0ACB6RTN6_9PLEO|nr:uncharacterized protein BU25DRAFT_460942 [Macroventuria anomochaeta]KAF2624775.1 hypothetical protein BU25DRAFT_460942 [Macroventuria anomochaeta]